MKFLYIITLFVFCSNVIAAHRLIVKSALDESFRNDSPSPYVTNYQNTLKYIKYFVGQNLQTNWVDSWEYDSYQSSYTPPISTEKIIISNDLGDNQDVYDQSGHEITSIGGAWQACVRASTSYEVKESFKKGHKIVTVHFPTDAILMGWFYSEEPLIRMDKWMESNIELAWKLSNSGYERLISMTDYKNKEKFIERMQKYHGHDGMLLYDFETDPSTLIMNKYNPIFVWTYSPYLADLEVYLDDKLVFTYTLDKKYIKGRKVKVKIWHAKKHPILKNDNLTFSDGDKKLLHLLKLMGDELTFQ